MPKPSRENQLAEFHDRLAVAKKYRSADEAELARAEFLQALAYAEKHFGPDSPEVDRACYELANFHAEHRESAAELVVLERRVQIRKLGGKGAPIVDALQDVAQCHASYDQLTEAEQVFREALSLCDDSNLNHHDALRMTLLYFGNFLHDHDRHAEAITQYEEALRVCALSKRYPSFQGARITAHLADAFFSVDRKLEAIALLEQAIPLVCHRSQRPSNTIAKLLYFLANHYHNEQRLAEADRTYGRAVLQTTSNSKPSYRNFAYILQAQACNDLKLQKPARAERHLQQALRHIHRICDEHHPDALSIQQDLINIYIPAGRYAEAEPILQAMVKASEHADFSDERAQERYLNNLGFVQVHLEEFPKAELNLRRALEIVGKDQGCYIIKNLGLMYQKMGYVTEAIREYEKALPLFETHYEANHSVAAFIRTALAELKATP